MTNSNGCRDGGADVGYARYHADTCRLSDDACRIADNPAESIVRVTLAGVRITADPDGSVTTMSDWTRADELVRAGMLMRRDHGPATYGAATYHLA